MSKRSDYLKWDDFFIAVSMITAQHRTKNALINTALILNYRRIIIGIGCEDSKENSTSNGIHATYKALNEAKPFMKKRNCTMYITRLPCETCIAQLIENGIVEIIYVKDRDNNSDQCKEILQKAGIKYRIFIADKKEILLDVGQF